jgi:hypothetical protein
MAQNPFRHMSPTALWAYLVGFCQVVFWDLRTVTFLILFGLFCTVGVSQGLEIGLRMAPGNFDSQPADLKTILLTGTALPMVALAFWLALSWYWSRRILAEKYPRAMELNHGARLAYSIVPWAMPLLAGAIIGTIWLESGLRSPSSDNNAIWTIVFLLALVVASLLFARYLSKELGREFKKLSLASMEQARVASEAAIVQLNRPSEPSQQPPVSPSLSRPKSLFALNGPWRRFMFWLLSFVPKTPITVSALLFIVMSFVFSTSASSLFGIVTSATVFFVFLACAVSILSWLALHAHRRKFPFALALLSWMVVGSALDKHYVSRLDTPQAERADLETALSEFIKRRQASGGKKLVIIATEGGGIRAAYWTTAILSKLQDQDSRFRDSVFAISGVSGGTVGAAVWVAMQRLAIDCSHKMEDNEGVPTKVCQDIGVYRAQFNETFARKTLGGDFLASAIGGLFFTDMTRKLIWFHGYWHDGTWPDRAQTLEEGWEAAWCANFATDEDCWDLPRLESTTDSIWYLGEKFVSGVPILIANGTDAKTGKRVITSPVKTSNYIQDSFDFFEVRSSAIKLR